MKKGNVVVVLVLVVALMFTLSAPAFAQEKQPHMEEALAHLREAKKSLEAAEANKGGHREKAIQLVDSAIKQVEDGIQYANQHEEKNEKKHK
jgi:uncharacterized protein HemX